jgi:hypothetical protein
MTRPTNLSALQTAILDRAEPFTTAAITLPAPPYNEVEERAVHLIETLQNYLTIRKTRAAVASVAIGMFGILAMCAGCGGGDGKSQSIPSGDVCAPSPGGLTLSSADCPNAEEPCPCDPGLVCSPDNEGVYRCN